MKKIILVAILSTILAACAAAPTSPPSTSNITPSSIANIPQVVWKSTSDNQAPAISAPASLAWDKDKNLLMLDVGYPRVLKFSRDGKYVSMWSFARGSGDGQFGNNPDKFGDMAVDAQGNVYVTDPGNNRIQKFDSNGKFLFAWGKQGTGDGEFAVPAGVAVDAQSNVYVVDNKSSTIQKFDAAGKFISKFGKVGRGQGEFYLPVSIAIDDQGNHYVGDGRIQKLDRTGKFISEWLLCASTEGVATLVSPNAVAFDRQGNVYAADYDGNHICKFNRDGNRILTWGSQGAGDGQFMNPAAIAVDDEGNVYVADVGNKRIQKFRQR